MEVLNLARVNAKEHMNLLPLRTLPGTHIVTGITWGMRNTLVMQHELAEDSQAPEIEQAFSRDLRQLKDITRSIDKGALHDRDIDELELQFKFYLYSDSSNEVLEMDDLEDMRFSIRHHLADVPNTNSGRGWPLTYTMVPISRLQEFVRGFKFIGSASGFLPIDNFSVFMSLFDEFASGKERLGKYYKILLENRPYVHGEHITFVNMAIHGLDRWKDHVQQRLAPMLESIRSGAVGPQNLHKLFNIVEAETGSPRSIKPLCDRETKKLRFLSKAVAEGAIYVGQGESPLEKIQTPRNDPGCRAILVNTAWTQHNIAWGAQFDSFIRLIRMSPQDNPTYVVDCDAPFCRLELEVAHLTRYMSGRELIAKLTEEPPAAATKSFDQNTQSSLDAKEDDQIHVPPVNHDNWQFPDTQDTDDGESSEDSEESVPLPEYCLARYGSNRSNTTNRSGTEEGFEPLDRRFIKIPCPGMHCNHNTPCEWICFHCSEPLEFCVTDEHIYCDCGHHPHTTYDFKCNGELHGPGFAKYPLDRLLTMLRGLKSLKSDSVNILILGETGVGKSTFINSFVNYLKYNTLDEAMEAEKLTAVIPCSFSTQIMNRHDTSKEIEEYVIRAGDDSREDEGDGSKGESATQQTTVYPITIGTTTYRLFDTPGIADTRGSRYDRENMADMMRTLSDYDVLHGILILLKSNSSRLNVLFKFCIQELLTHLHVSAESNLVFGFTNTRISNYAPGDVYGPLKKLLEERHNSNLTLKRSNVYCFDSESFRFLAAHFKHVQLPNIDDMRKSWAHSKEESQRLVEHFQSITPHNVNSTLSMNGARQQVIQLMRPMSEISHRISRSSAMVMQKKEDIKDVRLKKDQLLRKLHLEIPVPKIRKLAKPRTVCNGPNCTEIREISNGNSVKVHKKICHRDCKLANVQQETLADPALLKCRAFKRGATDKCTECECEWKLHMHVLYEVYEVMERVKDEEIRNMIKHNASDIDIREKAIKNAQRLVNEYEYELREMQEARAWFFVFLTKNAMAPINDATVEYLDMLIQDELTKIEAGRKLGLPVDKNKEKLEALRKDRQTHLDFVEAFKQSTHNVQDHQQLTGEGIQDLVESLYNLKHFGKDLKSLESEITSSHKATLRERPFRVSRPGGRQAARVGAEKRSGGEGAVVVHGGKHESRRKKGGQGGLGGWLPSLTRR
ncbi:hypothetical protein Neosp_007998 [[Neocosmospora] mangrovei]